MLSKLANLVGVYKRVGSTLTSQTHKLVIGTRQKTTPNKTHHFIVRKDLDGNNGVYISSLYPVDENIYLFDYQGRKYTLTISASSAKVDCLNNYQ